MPDSLHPVSQASDSVRSVSPAPESVAPDSDFELGRSALLEITSAVGIAAEPHDDGLSVELAAVGQFGERPGPVRERLEATVNDVVLSPLGTLTGVSDPRAAYTYEITKERVTVRGHWDAVKIARGLRAATSASIAEIVKK